MNGCFWDRSELNLLEGPEKSSIRRLSQSFVDRNVHQEQKEGIDQVIGGDGSDAEAQMLGVVVDHDGPSR
jgi:hypothetical protein